MSSRFARALEDDQLHDSETCVKTLLLRRGLRRKGMSTDNRIRCPVRPAIHQKRRLLDGKVSAKNFGQKTSDKKLSDAFWAF